jgi:hypothetical protein
VKRAVGLLLLAAAACNSGEPPPPVPVSETVRLTPHTPEAVLAVPAENGGKALVEITRVDNPELREVTLIVAFEGEKGAPQRFSLYPPDRAARIAVRVPDGARRMRVRIESREKLPALVEVRAAVFPR